MRHGFDIDDVMVDFIGGIASFHNRVYGTNLAKQDFDTYILSRYFGTTSDEAKERVVEFYESPEFENLAPVDGAVEAVCALKEKGDELHIITARGSVHTKEATLRFIERYFPTGAFSTVNFTYVDVRQEPVDYKWYVARNLGLDTMLEDSWTNAWKCSDLGIFSMLVDQPWNQPRYPEASPPFKRVKSWYEAAREIECKRAGIPEKGF